MNVFVLIILPTIVPISRLYYAEGIEQYFMFKSKSIIYICMIVTMFLIFIVVTLNGYAKPSEVVSPQHKLTADEQRKLKENTEVIHIKSVGEFTRVASMPSVRTTEIAHTVESAKSKTKVLILDYGILY
jgi:hypothetical protein